MGKYQLTLALLKPDIALNEQAIDLIRKLILKNQFLFVKSKSTKLSIDKTKQFYQAHEKKFFYNRLTYSMASGPIWCHILYHPEDAISIWRKTIGPTKVFKTIYEDPESIRGQFGITDTRNVCHGSDSEETAKQEINFFFPDFSIEDWFKNYESHFQKKNVTFNKNLCLHVPNLK